MLVAESIINEQVPPLSVPQQVQKPELADSSSKQALDVAPCVSLPKVDYATDLFNMLSMDDGPSENGSETASASDDNSWAGFQCMFLTLSPYGLT